MAGIAKTPLSSPPPDPPVTRLWLAPGTGLVARLRAAMAANNAHPARTLVLVPYAQLMPVAREFWAVASATGFVPRFESLRNLAQGLSHTVTPAPHDLRGEPARDLPTARGLLEQAGLGAQADGLAPLLLDTARSLAAVAQACPPAERAAWADGLRGVVGLGHDVPALATEARLARIALEWVAASTFETDALFTPEALDGFDRVVMLQGQQPEPLLHTLRERLGERAATLPMVPEGPLPVGELTLHGARDAEDEALRAAACVLRHVAAERAPVALVDTDRALTRRVRAQLTARGLAVRDETGWKLSTTRAAARLMGVLRAAAWTASGDDVLDALKNAPAFAPETVQALEQRLRRDGVREWSRWCESRAATRQEAGDDPALESLLAAVAGWREALQAPRSLPRWLAALREALVTAGLWERLSADAAGEALLAALHLGEPAERAFAESLDAITASRRLGLSDFTAWVDAVLEAESFKPPHPDTPAVVIVPLQQLLGRPFGAIVLPGADEQRLPAAPEPTDRWTTAQRAALGLPSREALALAQRRAWELALQGPVIDVLWRRSEGGEALLPSPLVQALQLEGRTVTPDSPCAARTVQPAPVAAPQPVGAGLPVARLSASAYGDLRQCPYKFFALRQLGLREADELETEVDKRDFGQWLHALLRDFHEAERDPRPGADRAVRRAALDAAAQRATQALRLGPGEFLPFEAAWPQVREGYLDWLAGHEASGARFAAAEVDREQVLDGVGVTLAGRLDRIDALGEGRFVLDYKTESIDTTRQRLKNPFEDTQLPFYAALLDDAAETPLRAAYVNISERDGTRTREQAAIDEARDALLQGVRADLSRIAAGAPLPALGQGQGCDFCAARGLCRKDWTA